MSLDKLTRAKDRVTAERDSYKLQLDSLKSEIDEEMERSHDLMKKCAEAEAKLAASQRQLQRIRMGNLSPSKAKEMEGAFDADREALEEKTAELMQTKALVKNLKEEVGKLRAARTEQVSEQVRSPQAAASTDLQECIALTDAAFEGSIREIDRTRGSLADPKYGEEEVKAMVEEVETMCDGYVRARGAAREKGGAAPHEKRQGSLGVGRRVVGRRVVGRRVVGRRVVGRRVVGATHSIP
jgi:chromosome segregation ATPase